jgi:hypothetical protein
VPRGLDFLSRLRGGGEGACGRSADAATGGLRLRPNLAARWRLGTQGCLGTTYRGAELISWRAGSAGGFPPVP